MIKYNSYRISGLRWILLWFILWGTVIASPITGTPNTFKMLRSMSRLYVALGEYPRAISAAEKAMTLARDIPGSNIDLALCKADLAYIYHQAGLPDIAEQMCRDSLALQEFEDGRSHLNIAYTKRILASICRVQGRYQEAEELLHDSLTIMHTQFSTDDPLLAPFKADIAELLTDLGRLEEAHLLYAEICEQLQQTYGPNHLYSSIVYRGLARLYIEEKDYESAQHVLDDVIRVQEEVYGVNNFQMVPTWLIQAALHEHRSEYDVCRKLLSRSLELTRQKLGDAHPSAEQIMDRLALLPRAANNLNEAISTAESRCEGVKRFETRPRRRQFGV